MDSQTNEVDEYLIKLKPERKTALEKLRNLILTIAPNIIETMYYKLPTYYYGDNLICAFASQKHYMSLYVQEEFLDKYREELAGMNLGKNCIRFKRFEDLPLETIEAVLRETMHGR